MREYEHQIETWLKLFIEPGQVTELRAIEVNEGGRWRNIESGFYDHDHLSDMARRAWQLSDHAKGVYFVPNPLIPDMLARCANRTQPGQKESQTSDIHVLYRKWLVIDADPVRLEGISSTDEEKAAAYEVIQKVKEWATTQGFTWVLCDSGNGYHCALRLQEWPRDDSGKAKKLLAWVGRRFGTEKVKIDPAMFNPSRITKVYGTLAKKGDFIPARPHRLSKVIEVHNV